MDFVVAAVATYIIQRQHWILNLVLSPAPSYVPVCVHSVCAALMYTCQKPMLTYSDTVTLEFSDFELILELQNKHFST